MDPLSIEQITHFAGAVRQDIPAERIVTHLSTDSRTVQPGDLFVALRGENFDGHKFVNDAFLRGAVGFDFDKRRTGAVIRRNKNTIASDNRSGHVRNVIGRFRIRPKELAVLEINSQRALVGEEYNLCRAANLNRHR